MIATASGVQAVPDDTGPDRVCLPPGSGARLLAAELRRVDQVPVGDGLTVIRARIRAGAR
ncbi:hypothetical protein ACFOWE_31305 [Planomonospora corallina]|uniref:Uncharacterized protein n=1 Tax=Planomonospora corallina TaxID=1806052 RepID=A0ABV8IHW9_9ACTN